MKRSDVWGAYSRQWRRGWKLKAAQAVIALSVFYLTLKNVAGARPVQIHHIVSAVLVTCVVLVFLPLYPLIRFKPQQRTLTITPEGISTTIGNRRGELPWRTIESVASESDRIYIVGRNQNSFVVPDHAFASPEERAEFFRLATQFAEGAKR
ncbi:MAG: YcxB family protein [Acidobacteriota bacterium]|nr:YcxB family protein [Acidobacteriota bacterium]